MSHPSWVCGLKPVVGRHGVTLVGSHPSWVCGLKHTDVSLLQRIDKSHPSWVCGLKQYQVQKANMDFIVTPFVGVWIETSQANAYKVSGASHTLRGCVD